MKILASFLALFVYFCAAANVPVAQAGGGGRAVIVVQSSGVAGGKAAEIVATIYKDNDSKISVDEFGLFRIRDAQPGQNCITKNQRSDGNGKIYGSCSSPVAGDMKVYIHFPDKVEDATAYTVSILPKGSATSVSTTHSSSGSQGPCGSGLVSYGWNPANGKTCPAEHYDAWTAYCGNGYSQDVQIGNCLHANQLTNHSEWRATAEEICRNPRCVRPATPRPVVTATPKPTASPSPTPVPTDAPVGETREPVLEQATPVPTPATHVTLFSLITRIQGWFMSLFVGK